MIYDNWNDVPGGMWPYKYFKPYEVACKGTGKLLIHHAGMLALDQFRSLLGSPVNLSSAYRSPYHNAVVGGAPRSSHLEGHAFDVKLNGIDKEIIHRIAQSCGFTGFGLNYNTFMHIDMGRARSW